MTAPTIERILRQIDAELRHRGLAYALIGGLAVSVRAEPRFTRDIDLAIGLGSDAAAEQLILGLRKQGYLVLAQIEQEETHRLATVRLIPPGQAADGIVIDILLASSGIEADVVDAAQDMEVVPELHLRVARLGHLLALKVLSQDDTTRPQDSMDIDSLIANANSDDLRLAESSVELIMERGYARGRDLRRALEERLDRLG